MKNLTFKWLTIGGVGMISLLLILTCLWKLIGQQDNSLKVAVIDMQTLLLSELKGHPTQSDAELTIAMKKLHSHIHKVARELSQETGVLILSKDSLLSKAEDMTEVVRKRLEQKS